MKNVSLSLPPSPRTRNWGKYNKMLTFLTLYSILQPRSKWRTLRSVGKRKELLFSKSKSHTAHLFLWHVIIMSIVGRAADYRRLYKMICWLPDKDLIIEQRWLNSWYTALIAVTRTLTAHSVGTWICNQSSKDLKLQLQPSVHIIPACYWRITILWLGPSFPSLELSFILLWIISHHTSESQSAQSVMDIYTQRSKLTNLLLMIRFFFLISASALKSLEVSWLR